ncbi:MAG TPA: thiosulfate oxidation carrier complex protein SoxZ [Pseudomonadales bacterium]|nr:thiosulfate oxidation carrier complex protein SoxZ [Pseudomonadales bacterium]
MAGKIRVRASLNGDKCEVKALMRHPMETGMRKDAQGNQIPAHFIKEVVAKVGDRVVMQAHWGAAVSQNPFLGFEFTGAKAGDVVVISYVDNKGETDDGSATVK